MYLLIYFLLTGLIISLMFRFPLIGFLLMGVYFYSIYKRFTRQSYQYTSNDYQEAAPSEKPRDARIKPDDAIDVEYSEHE